MLEWNDLLDGDEDACRFWKILNAAKERYGKLRFGNPELQYFQPWKRD